MELKVCSLGHEKRMRTHSLCGLERVKLVDNKCCIALDPIEAERSVL